MAESLSSRLRWIVIAALISAAISAYLVPLFSELYNVTGDSIVALSVKMYPTIAGSLSTIVTYLPYVLGVVGVVLLIWEMIKRRRKKDQKPIVIQTRMPDVKLIDNLPQPPILQYGKIRVKRSSEKSFGGVLDKLYYYIEIINSEANTVAINCHGDIEIGGDRYSTIWEKNRSDSISIAHRELLFLFEVLIFTKNSTRETRLYLKWGIHPIDDKSKAKYDDKINKEMTVLIHSENVRYPNESESFRKTVQQIISEAVAD